MKILLCERLYCKCTETESVESGFQFWLQKLEPPSWENFKICAKKLNPKGSALKNDSDNFWWFDRLLVNPLYFTIPEATSEAESSVKTWSAGDFGGIQLRAKLVTLTGCHATVPPAKADGEIHKYKYKYTNTQW